MNPTDPTRPPAAADDEIVSAVMDGEGTPAEVARVESDPVLTSRMAELRAVRDGVREATRTSLDAAPLDATVRARLIARAVAEVEPTPADVEPLPAVVLLARHRRTAGPWLIGAAAAVIVVLVATIAVTYGGSTGSSDDAGNDMASSAAESDAAATTTVPAGSEDDVATTTDPPGSVGAATPSSTASPFTEGLTDLGSHPDTASLLDAFARRPPSSEDSVRNAGPCAASLPPGAVVVAIATVGGRAVLVATRPGIDASPLVIDAATCTGSG